MACLTCKTFESQLKAKDEELQDVINQFAAYRSYSERRMVQLLELLTIEPTDPNAWKADRVSLTMLVSSLEEQLKQSQAEVVKLREMMAVKGAENTAQLVEIMAESRSDEAGSKSEEAESKAGEDESKLEKAECKAELSPKEEAGGKEKVEGGNEVQSSNSAHSPVKSEEGSEPSSTGYVYMHKSPDATHTSSSEDDACTIKGLKEEIANLKMELNRVPEIEARKVVLKKKIKKAYELADGQERELEKLRVELKNMEGLKKKNRDVNKEVKSVTAVNISLRQSRELSNAENDKMEKLRSSHLPPKMITTKLSVLEIQVLDVKNPVASCLNTCLLAALGAMDVKYLKEVHVIVTQSPDPAIDEALEVITFRIAYPEGIDSSRHSPFRCVL